MNSITEKEKKLNETIENLKKLDFNDEGQTYEIEKLIDQKNQLEIEYKELYQTRNLLEIENLKLKKQFEELKKNNSSKKQREKKLTEKIDELNKETDNLLGEIDKWQM
jgi:FtsZ-binding cell division protein ZapB